MRVRTRFWRLVEPERETSGGATGFDKLAQGRFEDLKTGRRKLALERIARAVKNECLTDVDCVRGEMNRVDFVENKTLFRRNPACDLGVGPGIESWRIIH